MKNTLKLLGILLLAIMVLACTKKSRPQTHTEVTALENPPETVAYEQTDVEETSSAEFQMDGTTLVKYNGNEAHVTIPSSVTEIGFEAFDGCKSLTSVIIPSSVTVIKEGAFYSCKNLTSVTIPSSVTLIGDGAFAYNGLTSVTFDLPSSVAFIGNSTFNGCASLTNINIPSSVVSIENNAFKDCSSLASIEIPSSVTVIENYAFNDCSNLTSVTLSHGTEVKNYAFPQGVQINYRD